MLLRTARLIVVTVVGTVVLIAGIIMLVTPGQGVLTILAGLGILGSEFPWAQRLLHRILDELRAWWHWVRKQIGWTPTDVKDSSDSDSDDEH